MFEYDGSNALKIEYEVPEEQSPKRAPQPKKKRRLSAKNKTSILLGVAIAFALAFTVLCFKAMLNTEYRLLGEKEAELSRITSEIEQIRSEIEGSGSLMAVEEKAAELGLVSAGEDQTVYLFLDNTDKGEILEEDNSNRGLHLFFNKLAVIMEYLY